MSIQARKKRERRKEGRRKGRRERGERGERGERRRNGGGRGEEKSGRREGGRGGEERKKGRRGIHEFHRTQITTGTGQGGESDKATATSFSPIPRSIWECSRTSMQSFLRWRKNSKKGLIQ